MKAKSIISLLFFIGTISLLIGVYGFYTIYDNSKHFEHTKGIVKHVTVSRVYEHRKMRRVQEAVINYDTKYGNYQTSMRISNPLIFQGTELTVWYKPDYPAQIVVPFEEVVSWSIPLGFGLLCIVLGVIGVKGKKEDDIEEIDIN